MVARSCEVNYESPHEHSWAKRARLHNIAYGYELDLQSTVTRQMKMHLNALGVVNPLGRGKREVARALFNGSRAGLVHAR